MFGAQRQALFSANPAGAPASDAPTIPTVTFSASGVNTTTERSVNGPHSMPFLGVSNSLYTWGANGMSTTTSQRNRHVTSNFSSTNFAQSIASGTSTQQQVSSSGTTNISNGLGGNHISIMGSSTDFRYRTGLVTGFTAGTQTSPGTVSAGSISAAVTRTSGITASPSVAAAHSPLIGSTGIHRFALFWQSSTSVLMSAGTSASNTTAFTLDITTASPATIDSGASVTGGFMDACGFSVPSASSTVKRYLTCYSHSSLGVRLAFVNVASTTVTTDTAGFTTGGTIVGTSVDSIWDDTVNNKYVGVACVEVSGNTYLRAYKNWGAGSLTTTTLGTAYTHGSQLFKCKAYKTGLNGLGVLVYTNSGFTSFFARFFSVDSSTLAITVSETEYTLGGVQNGGPIASFGGGTGLDASNQLCIGLQQSNHTAGSGVSGWTVYRSTAVI